MKNKAKGEGRKAKGRGHFRRVILVSSFFFILSSYAFSQARVTLIAPTNDEQSVSFAQSIAERVAGIKVVDADMSIAAFNSDRPADPFNMTTDEAKRAGAAIGCDLFVLVRSAVQRRSSSGRPEYYEAWAAVYLVSTRTGRLVDWQLVHYDADRPETAKRLLDASTDTVAAKITAEAARTIRAELNEPPRPPMEEPPSEETKNFHPPLPYRRLKPEYTPQANLYGIAATVEILVDIDATGMITRTEITRWAGYGLDEEVERTVRSMNWRAADRNGKPLPMRILLRYNFKKVDKS